MTTCIQQFLNYSEQYKFPYVVAIVFLTCNCIVSCHYHVIMVSSVSTIPVNSEIHFRCDIGTCVYHNITFVNHLLKLFDSVISVSDIHTLSS